MITRLLIANRGEIACRIIRTAKQLGLVTIAVYSTADKSACHVKLADEAYCIGEPLSQSSYLNQSAIIKVARQAKADAIHPGYGFLAENAEFARECQNHNIIFIGPTAEVIALMGDKAKAKNYLASFEVPLIPGYSENDQTPSTLLNAAIQIGFPVLLKAACGGGGKGMRIVNHQDEFDDNLQQAKQEALASFSDDRIIIEKYFTNPRHIEVQIFSDSQGNHVHLFERDCSIQRRHQKIIEEAPAPNISESLRNKLTVAAITIAQSIDYLGAGTIEFLTDEQENCYFMEMNTRLQVEHPVTEMITGIDLVAWQILVANGLPLPLKQTSIIAKGHAIEVRICAEDPSKQFLPSIGKLTHCQFPTQCNWLRVETGITEDDEITQYYDSMVAKLIIHADTRSVCIDKLHRALKQCYLLDIKTNIEFLQQIIQHQAFQTANVNTHFLSLNALQPLIDIPEEQVLIWACGYFYLALKKIQQLGLANWRLNHTEAIEYTLCLNGKTTSCLVLPRQNLVEVTVNQVTTHLTLQLDHHTLFVDNGIQQVSLYVVETNALHIWYFGKHYVVTQQSRDQLEALSDNSDQQINAPMPGTITAVFVTPGKQVIKGDKILVMEAMKMQHTLYAVGDGEIKAIYCKPGDFVKENTKLVELL